RELLEKITDRVSSPPPTKTKTESASSRASSRRPCNRPLARTVGSNQGELPEPRGIVQVVPVHTQDRDVKRSVVKVPKLNRGS
ncbi:hypothetical protein AVEN_183727-1, partial [Araneus ventricosus]